MIVVLGLKLVVCVCLVTFFVAFAVHERREMKRRDAHWRDEANKQQFRWRLQDRDMTVMRGRWLFVQTGDAVYDPDNYDSAWEYAEAVRARLNVASLIEVVRVERTARADGLVHRVVMLAHATVLVPARMCNPDQGVPKVDPVGASVTCLRCLAKEQTGYGT